MNFIGIDLAWTNKNESGICIIGDNGKIALCEANVYNNDQLVEIIDDYSGNGALVAIDAPLIVDNDTGSRKCEREFMSNKINGFQVSIRSSSKSFMMKYYNCIRGVELIDRLRHNLKHFALDTDIWTGTHKLMEVFPTGSCVGLFPEIGLVKYKINKKKPLEMSKKEMLRLLNFIHQNLNSITGIPNFDEFFMPTFDIQTMSKRQYKNIEDKFDAFICALTAYYCYFHKEVTKTFGNIHEGFIILPIINQSIKDTI